MKKRILNLYNILIQIEKDDLFNEIIKNKYTEIMSLLDEYYSKTNENIKKLFKVFNKIIQLTDDELHYQTRKANNYYSKYNVFIYIFRNVQKKQINQKKRMHF